MTRTKMENDTLSKIYENELIANAKRNNLSPIEMAHLVDEYLKIEIAKGTKLSEIEKRLCMTKRVLYKYRSILKLPAETLAKYKDKLSFEQMSIVSYSVKDKSKIPEVLEQVAIDNTPSNELVYKVAEINDKAKIASHILGELHRMQLWVIGLKDKVKKMPPSEQKRVRESIEDLVGKLNGI
jgi:uncharacterized protein YfkK (UPF0435 family)